MFVELKGKCSIWPITFIFDELLFLDCIKNLNYILVSPSMKKLYITKQYYNKFKCKQHKIKYPQTQKKKIKKCGGWVDILKQPTTKSKIRQMYLYI